MREALRRPTTIKMSKTRPPSANRLVRLRRNSAQPKCLSYRMCGNSGQSPKEAGLRTLLESIRLKRGRSEEKARKRATHTGHQQEEPYLRHRLSADHECRT